MAALSPKSTNLPFLKPGSNVKKDTLAAKAAATRNLQREKNNLAATAAAAKSMTREKDHPPAPPPLVNEPDEPDGRKGAEYVIGKYLGKGGFAICYEGELKSDHSELCAGRYALKIVKSVMPQPRLAEKFKTELQIHSKMHHPNIVEFHRAFTFGECTFVVLELCQNGSLMDMVKRRKFLSEAEVRRYVIQMCGAIKYMHFKNIIHRDLKMGNIFLDGDMNIKIGDFGLAAILLSGSEYTHNRRRTLCGTPNYIAPEVLAKNVGGHDNRVDIWSLGIIIYAMLVGSPPFQSKTQDEIYTKVKARSYRWPSVEKCPNIISQQAKDLVALLLVDADERPGPDDIVSHSFFKCGSVPDSLPAYAKLSKPSVPEWSPATGLSQESWCQNQWEKLCRQCGVGRLSANETYPVVGDELNTSIYKDCLLEEKANRIPTLMIAKKLVYKPLPLSRTWKGVAIDGQPSYSTQAQRAGSENHIMPGSFPASVYEDSSQQQVCRAKTLAPNASIDSVVDSGINNTNNKAQSRPLMKSRAAQLREQVDYPTDVVKSTKANNRPSSDEGDVRSTTKEENQAKPAPSRMLSGGPIRPKGRLAPLQRVLVPPANLRITRSRNIQEQSGTGILGTPGTNEAGISGRKESNSTEEVVIVSNRVPSSRRQPQLRSRISFTNASNKAALAPVEELSETDQSPVPQEESKVKHIPTVNSESQEDRPVTKLYGLIGPEESSETISCSKVDEIHTRLSTTLDTLRTALNRRQPNKRPAVRRSLLIPIVSKWVDYTNKYGIAYSLSDGTAGCLLNTGNSGPSGILVRKATSSTGKVEKTSGKDDSCLATLNGRPVEFYENNSQEGVKCLRVESKKYMSFFEATGEGKTSETSLTDYDNRKRRIMVLWSRFATFMGDSLTNDTREDRPPADPSPADEEKQCGGPCVVFYQRLGNVGAWGFGGGGFQFNFPDHTKLIFTDGATHFDFYHLSEAGVRELERTNQLSHESLKQRTILSYPLRDLVCKDLPQVAKMNQLEEKLRFCHEVISQWIKHRGLGRIDQKDRIRWKGLGAQKTTGKPEKLVWVTVGAAGGDARYAQAG